MAVAAGEKAHKDKGKEWFHYLPGNVNKYKLVDRAHLGHYDLQCVPSLAHFVTLEVLFLNDNCLSSLVGLEPNFRLKELHVQGNLLAELEPPVFRALRHLRVLNAGRNRLRDLDQTLAVVAGLDQLKALTLAQNPLETHMAYPAHFRRLPGIEVVDNAKVDAAEKTAKLVEATLAAPPRRRQTKRSLAQQQILEEAQRIRRRRASQPAPPPPAPRVYPPLERMLPRPTAPNRFQPVHLSALLKRVSAEPLTLQSVTSAVEGLLEDPLNIAQVPRAAASELRAAAQLLFAQSSKPTLKGVQQLLAELELVRLPSATLREQAEAAHREAVRLQQLKDPRGYAFAHKFLKYERMLGAGEGQRPAALTRQAA